MQVAGYRVHALITALHGGGRAHGHAFAFTAHLTGLAGDAASAAVGRRVEWDAFRAFAAAILACRTVALSSAAADSRIACFGAFAAVVRIILEVDAPAAAVGSTARADALASGAHRTVHAHSAAHRAVRRSVERHTCHVHAARSRASRTTTHAAFTRRAVRADIAAVSAVLAAGLRVHAASTALDERQSALRLANALLAYLTCGAHVAATPAVRPVVAHDVDALEVCSRTACCRARPALTHPGHAPLSAHACIAAGPAVQRICLTVDAVVRAIARHLSPWTTACATLTTEVAGAPASARSAVRVARARVDAVDFPGASELRRFATAYASDASLVARANDSAAAAVALVVLNVDAVHRAVARRAVLEPFRARARRAHRRTSVGVAEPSAVGRACRRSARDELTWRATWCAHRRVPAAVVACVCVARARLVHALVVRALLR